MKHSEDKPYPMENFVSVVAFFTIFFFRRVYGIKSIKFGGKQKIDRRHLFIAAGGLDMLKP
jgi:hypothetical protein